MIRVSAPTRLHFGLLHVPAPGSSFAPFGGLGAMLDVPRVSVSATPSSEWRFTGSLAARTRQFSERIGGPPHALIADGPSEHVGLGVGTALGLAVANVLSPIADKLADLAGRGERSHIGVHGFTHGGFLLDRGHGQRVERMAFPSEWRFVLLQSPNANPWHGDRERTAFARARSASDADATTKKLIDTLDQRLKPALAARDFSTFALALADFNRIAGEPFAADQAGAFVSSAIRDLIALIRARGFDGVGQSSWGPTVFALLPDLSSAIELAKSFSTPKTAVSIAKVAESGAVVCESDSD